MASAAVGYGPAPLTAAAAADPNCASGMPYDVNGNPCPSTVALYSTSPGPDPNCASGMPYDVNGNPCPSTNTNFQATVGAAAKGSTLSSGSAASSTLNINSLVSSLGALAAPIATAVQGPVQPKPTTLSLGSSGLNFSSGLFSNPIVLVLLAVLAFFAFTALRKRA